MLGIALAFAIGIFWSVVSALEGSYGTEVFVVMVIGALGGALNRIFVPENRVTPLFLALVVAEGVVLSQFPLPWSGLWMVLIPANAVGVMAGGAIRGGIADARPRPKDVWIVNGVEEKQKVRAQSMALDALASWDSAKSGRFFVERNDGLFEAVGNPTAGFIVHCAAAFQDESAWRILGSTAGQGESEIRLPSGPAHTPTGVVTDLQATSAALRGFFHHRGPDPELPWSAGEDVLDLRFG